ncbi:MAG TPA: CsbD family protein [Terriglobia bacterium]|nr:CsbD family protein [Terriglobia bacterium]
MNWDQVEGKWKQVKGSAKEKWGKLTDDDLDVIAGKRDKLLGKLQERYGVAKEDAQRQVDEWSKTVVAKVEAVKHSVR